MLLCRCGQAGGPVIDHRLIGSLNHDAQQWFCPTRSHQHTSVFSHRGLCLLNQGMERCTVRPTLSALAIRDAHIHQFLGIGLKALIHPLGQGELLRMAEARDLKSGQDTIT